MIPAAASCKCLWIYDSTKPKKKNVVASCLFACPLPSLMDISKIPFLCINATYFVLGALGYYPNH
jgi:hypothetical protein